MRDKQDPEHVYTAVLDARHGEVVRDGAFFPFPDRKTPAGIQRVMEAIGTAECAFEAIPVAGSAEASPSTPYEPPTGR